MENIDELEFLKGINKKPFKTPEGYFEGLEDDILNKLAPPKANLRVVNFVGLQWIPLYENGIIQSGKCNG